MPTDELLIRVSARRQRPLFLRIGAMLVVFVVLSLVGGSFRWVGLAGVVVSGVILAVGAAGVILGQRRDWEMKLDAGGVTARGQRTVGWDDIGEVRVTPLFRSVPSSGIRTEVAAFVPAAGVVFPPGPSVPMRGLVGRIGRPMRQRLYGSDLIVLLSSTDTDLASFAAAVERYGHKQVITTASR
jgi:hypothetical protein